MEPAPTERFDPAPTERFDPAPTERFDPAPTERFDPALIEPPLDAPRSNSLRFDESDPDRPPRRRRRRAPLLAGVTLLAIVGAAVGVLAGTGVFARSTASSSGGSNIPVGWVVDNESVFSIYHPPGWTRQSVTASGAYSAYGEGPELYERVQVLAPADPLTTVKALDAAKTRTQKGYHLLTITHKQPALADIEWTEVDGGTTYELLERAYLHNNRLYTLLFFTRADLWQTSLPTFQAISNTFTPLG
jgi:hypothetical protein